MQDMIHRAKPSLRMQYDAEAAVIQKKIGNIDDIRLDLGLSKRQMAQLLLVDPSSLTRWNNEGEVPTYIYRALQWYLALINKQPEWHPQNRFGFPKGTQDLVLLKNEIEKLKTQSQQKLESLEKKMNLFSQPKKVHLGLYLFCFFAGIFITYIIMR